MAISCDRNAFRIEVFLEVAVNIFAELVLLLSCKKKFSQSRFWSKHKIFFNNKRYIACKMTYSGFVKVKYSQPQIK